MFKQLEEFRPFELLRSSRDRIHYLLVKEAKIIAMTCTHAALKRKDLVELSFKVAMGREGRGRRKKIESHVKTLLYKWQYSIYVMYLCCYSEVISSHSMTMS